MGNLMQIDFKTGKLVSAEDTNIDVQVNHLYYWGSYVWPSIVYTTRKDDTSVYYVYVVDNGRYPHKSECNDSLDSFKLFVHSAERNVKAAIKDANFDDFRVKESNNVWNNNVDAFVIPSEYESFEDARSRRIEESRIESERQSKIKRYTTKETAKLVRTRVKKFFPETKFSVRKRGYNAIDVKWFNGPTVKQVEEILGMYCGAGYDMYEDMKTYHDTIDPDTGEMVHYGNDYISFDRKYTYEVCENMLEKFLNTYSGVYEADYEISTSSYDNSSVVVAKNYRQINYPGRNNDLQSAIRDFMSNTSFEETQKPETKKESEYSEPKEDESGVSYSEYKGKPVINLPMGNRDFSFGLTKAQLIIEYIDQIKQFVKDNE